MQKNLNLKLIIYSLLGILSAVIVYAFGRIEGNVIFLDKLNIHLDVYSCQFLSYSSNYIPDYLHTFSFALLTAGFFPKNNRQFYFIICLIWFFIDSLFEIAQFFGTTILNNFFYPFSFISNNMTVSSFLSNGTYDSFDILAYLLGAITAFFIIIKTLKTGEMK